MFAVYVVFNGMHSMGEEVKVDLQAEWLLEEDDTMMMVDSHEDDWGRLNDVRVSGMVRHRESPLIALIARRITVTFGERVGNQPALTELWWKQTGSLDHRCAAGGY
ncbi:hypothetical protein GOODEAATRI_016216 [Goodea atripinnis]|uniref:Uncharacterized protein n=1 Tax=Goodea atripinnis TaxID=208336 RepID=A0ABV0P4K0_9TELE